MTFKVRRRSLLAGGLAAAGGAYLYQRGVRYPTLSLEAEDLPTSVSISGVRFNLTDCFLSFGQDQQFRAFAPEPEIRLESPTAQRIQFSLNNISTEAELESDHKAVTETADGITRQVTIDVQANEEIQLKWRVPFSDDFTFASIGDSGGNHELDWCLKRSAELGAKFLLHLGDFNYQDGDYQRSIELFYKAPIPCYISIGNHDFHDSGLLHHQFTDSLGPFNNVFSLGGIRFLNLDTAANVWPRSAGKRGRLIKGLLDESQTQPATLAITHRPLYDPTGDSSHDIGSRSERDWLIEMLKALNAKTLVCGHIHIFDRSEFKGLDQIIVGQGMGHQDLLTANIETSKIALGHVKPGHKVDFSFAPLNLPFELHCHPRIEPVKASLREGEHAELIKQIDAACRLL